MLYYNHRLTNTREDLRKTKEDLAAFGVNFGDTSKPPIFKDWRYDWQEPLISRWILAMSCVTNMYIWVMS